MEAVGARERLSQLLSGPSALKIAFYLPVNAFPLVPEDAAAPRSPKDADEREMVIWHIWDAEQKLLLAAAGPVN